MTATRSASSTTTRPSTASSSRCRCRRTIRLRTVIDAIDPAKDIDGIHPLNAGLLRLGYDGLPAGDRPRRGRDPAPLRRSRSRARDAVVIGRSAVVGMPAAFLLVKEDATVTVCHSRTRDLAGHVRRADIVVVAAGQPGPRHRARCSSPAPSSSTSGSTWSTGGSSATSTSNRRARSPRRSRRSPAASGR